MLGDDRVVATFALYSRETGGIAQLHQDLVHACVHLCQIAFQQNEQRREIERLAFHDDITDLPNRALFQVRAQQALQLARRQGTPVTLMMLDLDRFKMINDSLGHAVGDAVLRSVGQRLSGVLRAADTLARLGGDEFVALLPGCRAEEAMRVAAKVHAQLVSPLVLPSGAPIQISASVGLCTFPQDGDDLDTLLRGADMAMYEAKREGRNCSKRFLREMDSQLEARMTLESDLRRALVEERSPFHLHFQPKLDMRTGELRGVEVLIRWRHPVRGEISPAEFIPAAEECGLVDHIDAWSLEAACEQLARWRQDGVGIDRVSVNVSPTRFFKDDVAGHARRLLDVHRLDPAQLTFEITERLLLHDDSRTRSQLEALHAMGLRLSVDDFGTGYSSLGYLKRLPVSELKLDRTFVCDLETNADDRALAQAVIAVGCALGLDVVAEGVETEGQHQLLREAGCHVAQGYWYARPQPPDALARWLQGR